jgi:hypothetical protein
MTWEGRLSISPYPNSLRSLFFWFWRIFLRTKAWLTGYNMFITMLTCYMYVLVDQKHDLIHVWSIYKVSWFLNKSLDNDVLRCLDVLKWAFMYICMIYVCLDDCFVFITCLGRFVWIWSLSRHRAPYFALFCVLLAICRLAPFLVVASCRLARWWWGCRQSSPSEAFHSDLSSLLVAWRGIEFSNIFVGAYNLFGLLEYVYMVL